MKDWPSIRAWRRETRKELIARRSKIPPNMRGSTEQIIREQINANFADLNDSVIGFYWPINAEIDLRPLLRELLASGAEAALPVVVEKDQPLEFWQWRTDSRMSRDIGNIPAPSNRKPVQPTVLLIPLLGFDTSGHRLGYGGGYYDRTLAALRLKPLAIGVGYEFGRLSTIHPQAHDVPLDAIVTESGCTKFDNNQLTRSDVSSPPCYLHEFDTETE